MAGQGRRAGREPAAWALESVRELPRRPATTSWAGAVRTYHECVSTLRRELGVEPSEVTTQSYDALMRPGQTAPTEPGGEPAAVGGAVLVDAAVSAGAEVCERFTVEDIVVEDGAAVGIRGHAPGGQSVLERARVVVGADGRNSQVTGAVRPERYNEKPQLLWGYYTYWSDLPVCGFETVVRPNRGWGAAPRTTGSPCWLSAGPRRRPMRTKPTWRPTTWARSTPPEFAHRVRAATRQERFFGGGGPNFFCKPFGPGWALVGDAGYIRDPITAQGISDAFRYAELCATALDESLDGRRPFDDAMGAYQSARDARVMGMYEFTTQMATLEPPPPEMQELLGAVYGNQDAMDAFASVAAGTPLPPEFFSPEHVGQVMGATGSGQGYPRRVDEIS